MFEKLLRVRSFAPAARRCVPLRCRLPCVLVSSLAAATAVAGSQVEEYRVTPRDRKVTVVCPTLQTTRIVLPERVTGYRGDPASEAALGFQIQTRPEPVISVHPRQHPIEARFRIDGVTRPLVLVFRTAADGVPREMRLTFGSRPTRHAPVETRPPAAASRGQVGQQASVPAPAQVSQSDPGLTGSLQPSKPDMVEVSEQAAPAGPAADADRAIGPTVPAEEVKASLPDVRPSRGSAPRPPAPSPGPGVPTGLLDAGILTARVRSIGRVERLPGQRPVELVDILEGGRHVWLRFSVGDAKGARVDRVSWEHGPITSYAVEEVEDGKRLALVVQLPRRSETGTALITKRTRVHLKLDDGERRFALSAPCLGTVAKDLFGW